MKKYLALTLIFLCLGTFCWAQGTKTTLFDVVKSQQEMEIMKQILGTTLSFVAQNIQRQQATGKVVSTPFGPGVAGRDTYRFTNMNAFYLYGQGAVFVIPTSNLRFGGFGSMSFGMAGTRDLMSAEREIEAASRQMDAAARALERGAGTGITGGIAGGVSTPPPPPPPPATPQAVKPPTATPAPAAPPAKSAPVSQDDLRKKVAEAQEKVKKVREDSEANRAKFLQSLGEIKSFLIEALANHGDSLTTVKPNEYITLVIMLDDFGDMNWYGGDATGDRAHEEVVSVQKSWITDYKAGRLTLEAFKQKAIQYAQ